MTIRSRIVSLLVVALGLVVGCDSKQKPSTVTTISAPPPAAGETPPAVASVGATTPANSGNGETATPETTGSTTPTTPAVGKPTATVAPEGALTAHAAALAIVQPDHFAVVKFEMAKMRNSAFLQSLPIDPQQMASNLPVPGAPRGEEAAQMAKHLEAVETLWVSLGPPQGAGPMPFSLAIYARCTSPAAAVDALKGMQLDEASSDRMEFQGTAYFKSKQPGGPIWSVQGSDVYISSDENVVRNAIMAKGHIADSDLLKKLATAKLDAPLVVAGSFGPFKEPISSMAVNALKESPIPLSPELGNLPKQIEFGVVAIDLDAQSIIDIDADMDADQSAENFKTSLEGIVSLAKIMLGQQAAAAVKQGENDPDTQKAFGIAKAGLDAVTVKNEARHVDASFNRFVELADLPALMTVQIERAKTMQYVNNAKMLGLAAHNQQLSMRRWPANVKNAAGDTLLSWRYEVLPYVEEMTLHEQLKRDEPWDSASNQQVTTKMPSVFATPSTTEPNTTTWKMLPDNHPSNIMMLDTGKGTAIHWLRPDNFNADPGNPAAALGEEPAGGYITVNRDGSVQRLPRAELVAKLSGKPVEGGAAGENPTGETPAVDGPLADQEPRIWHSGRSKIKALLLGVKDGKATLKRIDTNRELTVPLEKLSPEDQEYIRSLGLPQ